MARASLLGALQKPKPKATKKVEKKEPKYTVILTLDTWGGGLRIKKEEFVQAFEEDDEEGWYSDRDGEEVIADVYQEETCCGFDIIGNWSHSFYVPNKENWEQMGQMLATHLKKNKIKYLSTYLPDTKEYKNYRTLVEAAGFKEGVSVVSKHSTSYKNTRWEYFGKGTKIL